MLLKDNVYGCQKSIQMLERILRSAKASREKKILAMIGLVNIARKEMRIYN
ncbi:hypothetical protein ACFL5U_02470 [Candidatus Margulisiibacteriota bacterium]